MLHDTTKNASLSCPYRLPKKIQKQPFYVPISASNKLGIKNTCLHPIKNQKNSCLKNSPCLYFTWLLFSLSCVYCIDRRKKSSVTLKKNHLIAQVDFYVPYSTFVWIFSVAEPLIILQTTGATLVINFCGHSKRTSTFCSPCFTLKRKPYKKLCVLYFYFLWAPCKVIDACMLFFCVCSFHKKYKSESTPKKYSGRAPTGNYFFLLNYAHGCIHTTERNMDVL